MIRVVADTNVYISALIFHGLPEEILALAQSGAFSLYISPAIQQELSSVLARKFGWDQQRLRDALSFLTEFVRVVIPKAVVTVIAGDEPDNRILECALEARAHVILTGDRHLLRLKNFQGTNILGLRDFLSGLKTHWKREPEDESTTGE